MPCDSSSSRSQPPQRHRVKVLGFTTEIDELMTVADIVLTKPGGLTTSEVLARGAAMAVVNPIPGQESRNSDFLLENGAAIKINNIGTMSMKLTELLADPPSARASQEQRPQARQASCGIRCRSTRGLPSWMRPQPLSRLPWET